MLFLEKMMTDSTPILSRNTLAQHSTGLPHTEAATSRPLEPVHCTSIKMAVLKRLETLRYATARYYYYCYLGREGLGWQRCFTRQTQMIKILLYRNGMCSWLVFTKMSTFKETRDYSTFIRNRLDSWQWFSSPVYVLHLPELRFAF